MGRGTFKSFRDDQEIDAAIYVPIELEASSTNVIFNGLVTTLGRVILDKQKTEPQVKIAYHEIVPSETRAGEFTLKVLHRVVFEKRESETDSTSTPYTQNNIGSAVPFSRWRNNVSDIIWAVGWTAKGLNARKPLVYTRVGMKISTAHAVVVE